MTMQSLPLFDVEHNAAGIMPKADPRRRLQFKFWLATNVERDRAVGEYLHEMKKKRKMLPTIRDAIRLIRDLRAGRVDVLLELFPFVRDAIAPPQPSAGDEFAEIIADQQAILLAKIDALSLAAIQPDPPLEARTAPNPAISSPDIAQNPGITAPDVSEAPRASGPRPMAVPQFAAPEPDISDDDVLIIHKDANAGKQATANFLSSVQALVG